MTKTQFASSLQFVYIHSYTQSSQTLHCYFLHNFYYHLCTAQFVSFYVSEQKSTVANMILPAIQQESDRILLTPHFSY